MKYLNACVFFTLLLVGLVVWPSLGLGQQLRAIVTFLDGSSLALDSPRLIYGWKPHSLTNFLDTGRESAASQFYYVELAPQGEIGRQIPLGSIQRVVFRYSEERGSDRPEATAVLQDVSITDHLGRTVLVTPNDLFGTRNQLPSALVGERSDPAVFYELLMEGRTARGRGQSDAFRSRLITPGRTSFLLRPQRPNEICQGCAPPSAVIREILLHVVQ